MNHALQQTAGTCKIFETIAHRAPPAAELYRWAAEGAIGG